MCQGTEERGRISRVCEMAEANLTQASVDDKQLIPSCLAASVQRLFTISTALGSCQRPLGFGVVIVKKDFVALHLQISDCSFNLPANVFVSCPTWKYRGCCSFKISWIMCISSYCLGVTLLLCQVCIMCEVSTAILKINPKH